MLKGQFYYNQMERILIKSIGKIFNREEYLWVKKNIQVLILMGSDSDLPIMKEAAEILDNLI